MTFEKWLRENETAWFFSKKDGWVGGIEVRALAKKIAYMSRAEMATMRTYFRKQVNWKPKVG